MVQLTRIYTRGGDQGETSLGDGSRVSKQSRRVEAMGTVDEINAVIGLARLHTANNPNTDALLARIQNDLFDLGADLCFPEQDEAASTSLRIIPAQVARLEQEIDTINAPLAPLNSFVLPGGTALAATLHLARTTARRAERIVVALSNEEAINPEAVKYLNRLSDHFFVLSRHANENGVRDVLWVPGLTR